MNKGRNRKLLGFKFRRQHQFGDYVADFYCHEAHLVIECDGPVHQGGERWHHDQNRDAYMIGQDLRVLRFSNEQILNETENVLDEIAEFLPSPRGRGSKANQNIDINSLLPYQIKANGLSRDSYY